VFAIDIDVFVAASGQVDDEGLALRDGRAADRLGYGVCGFHGGNDAFGAAENLRGGERVVVAAGAVFGAPAVVQPGVFGADGSVVEAGGNGVGGRDLTVFVLQDVTAG